MRIVKQDLADMRLNTMACWWPSRVWPRAEPDWAGIAGELEYLIRGETFYFEERGSDSVRLLHLKRLVGLARDQARGQ